MLNKKAMMAAPAAVPQYIEDVFSTYLYTGNFNNLTINNGIDLAGKGGLVWTKSRTNSATAARNNHFLLDSSRGWSNNTGKYINSNTTATESNVEVSFVNPTSTGYTLGQAYYGNENALPYASWTFRKAPKFFDVVTYAGTGTNRTVAHNLGSVPGMIIVKRTDVAADWQVYHRSLANTEYMVLNSTAVKATGATRWNSTTPTATEFSLGTDVTVNASGGTYVAYLFAHDAGGFGDAGNQNVVSCGSFSGATEINLGWEPQYVLVKMTNAGEPTLRDWEVYDNMRGMGASISSANALFPNLSSAESVGFGGLRITSTGFVPNLGADNFIYLAIRRGPMKTPTSGTQVFSPNLWTQSGGL